MGKKHKVNYIRNEVCAALGVQLSDAAYNEAYAKSGARDNCGNMQARIESIIRHYRAG